MLGVVVVVVVVDGGVCLLGVVFSAWRFSVCVAYQVRRS